MKPSPTECRLHIISWPFVSTYGMESGLERKSSRMICFIFQVLFCHDMIINMGIHPRQSFLTQWLLVLRCVPYSCINRTTTDRELRVPVDRAGSDPPRSLVSGILEQYWNIPLSVYADRANHVSLHCVSAKWWLLDSMPHIVGCVWYGLSMASIRSHTKRP